MRIDECVFLAAHNGDDASNGGCGATTLAILFNAMGGGFRFCP